MRAVGRIAFGDDEAGARLAAILSGESKLRSIALPPRSGRPARVAHAIWLAGAVRDPFSTPAWLLILNVAGRSNGQPDVTILRALFDLSPAESRLAAALATGIDLAAAAARCGIRINSARSYLQQVFAKTGCHRQGELVSLLASVTVRPADTAQPSA